MNNTRLFNGLLKSDQKAFDRILELTKVDLEKQIKYLVHDCPKVNDEQVQIILKDVYVESLDKYREEALKNKSELMRSFNSDIILIRCIEALFVYSWIIFCLHEWIKSCIELNYFANKDFPDKRLIELEEIFDRVEIKIIDNLKESIIKEPRRDHSKSYKALICRNRVIDFIKSNAWKNRPDKENIPRENPEIADESGKDSNNEYLDTQLEKLSGILPPEIVEDFKNETKELSNELSEKLGTLCKINQKHLQMFIMHKVYGKAHREIAEIYRVTERTSVTTVKRVLDKLRKCLGLK